jgi:hypothetical protein
MDRAFNVVREEVLALDSESQAWRTKIRRRTEAYRRGEIATVDSDDVMARARQKIANTASRNK